MSELYNAEYYKQYDVGCGKVDYSDSEYTKGFLTQIAQKIVDDLHPKTVLDAGCAMGHLVAALRDLGVEAYGVDVSEYAILGCERMCALTVKWAPWWSSCQRVCRLSMI